MALVGIATTVALLGGTAWRVLSAISPDRLVAVAAAQTKAATGRDLVIGSRVDVRVFPAPAVSAEDIRFGNAGWSSRPDMICVRHAEGQIAFWPLIRGRVQIRRIVLVGSDVLLEMEAAGTGNWLFRREGEPVTGAEPMPEIVLDVLRIQDAQIAFRDGKSGHETRLAIERLTVDGQDDGERLSATLLGRTNRSRRTPAQYVGPEPERLIGYPCGRPHHGRSLDRLRNEQGKRSGGGAPSISEMNRLCSRSAPRSSREWDSMRATWPVGVRKGHPDGIQALISTRWESRARCCSCMRRWQPAAPRCFVLLALLGWSVAGVIIGPHTPPSPVE